MKLTDEQIEEGLKLARMGNAGDFLSRLALALQAKLEQLQARIPGYEMEADRLTVEKLDALAKLSQAEAQLKPIADWLGSPKDNHRLGEVIPGVLASYRQRCEAAEAERDEARRDLKTTAAEAQKHGEELGALDCEAHADHIAAMHDQLKCSCNYDRKGDVCAWHAEMLSRALAEKPSAPIVGGRIIDWLTQNAAGQCGACAGYGCGVCEPPKQAAATRALTEKPSGEQQKCATCDKAPTPGKVFCIECRLSGEETR